MATKDKRHTLHVKEEDVPMAEETPQNPQGPASGGPTPAEAPPEKPPTLEEALASLGAPQVVQSGHDGREKFQAWLEDFIKKNPDALKTKAQVEAEKKAKEEEAKKEKPVEKETKK